MTEEVELEVIETEPSIHDQIIEEMQEYAEQDTDYSDLVILVTPKERHILSQHTVKTSDGTEHFCDAQVIQHWSNLPKTPLVIPKQAIRRIIGEQL